VDGSVHLIASERKTLLECYRKSADPAVRLRAHILLLLTDSHPWNSKTGRVRLSRGGKAGQFRLSEHG
jgi:hypothetical protein